MKADIRVIQLMRKVIRRQSEMTDMDEREQSDYFATDYFDVMKVEKKELSSPLNSIMGIWSDEKIDISDIAAQSYSLYCSKEMMKFEKKEQKCGDPFERKNEGMQFLSIIQVHITPEVMAKALPDKTAEEVMDAVYKDLHGAIREFIDTYMREQFIFRIYKMLSAGDFAVVLCSAGAETSFKLSSLLRRRVIAGSGEKKIVLYKTYTILAIGNNIIRQEIKGLEGDTNLSQEEPMRKGRFVLRCSYSNLYWSNKEKADAYLNGEDIFSGIQLYGLNGRYDFSVRITEKQFLELFHDIKTYKVTGMRLLRDKGAGMGKTNIASSKDGIVKYFKFLMENGYLSYINERYLVAKDENSEELNLLLENRERESIYTTSNELGKEFLDCIICKKYELVMQKYQSVCEKVERIKDYRRNMRQYMYLIDKLLKLCYGINGYSDTRINAAVLLEQLDVILDSIHVYVKMYNNATEEKEEILYLLEEYIRESVCALDSYAQYLRNNNLQSLQIPNYNIESNMSMEKLLIGYSELLKVFTDFYQSWKTDRVGIVKSCEYLPIVIPVLSKRDVSVETLFHKGVMNDWEYEKKIRSELNNDSDRCCMVISVPTLIELGNVQTMITSLFHEVAHQFRYETRKERNDALLKYIIHTFMRDLINKLMHKLENDIGLRDWNKSAVRRLEMCLVNTYMEMNYMNEKGELQYSFQEAPLSSFQCCFERDLCAVFGGWEINEDIKPVCSAFLKEIMCYYQPFNSRCQEAIGILNELIKKLDSLDYSEDTDEQVVKCAYCLSWECACQNVNYAVEPIWGEDLRKWIEDENEIKYREMWDEVFKEVESGKKSEFEMIWDNFLRFSHWIYENYGVFSESKKIKTEKKIDFLKRAYQKMCREWTEEETQNDLTVDFNCSLSFLGRALGIDCNTEENYKVFVEQMSFIVNSYFGYFVEMTEWRIGKYREETADMFMCNAMKLTPFGYMHMLAIGWPSNQELPAGYFSRSQNILLLQWCLSEEGRLSKRKFMELCLELTRELECAIGMTAQSLIDLGAKLESLQNINTLLESEDENQERYILNRIENLNSYCDKVEDKTSELKDSSIKTELDNLRFYGIMAHVLGQLVDLGEAQINYLNDFEELRDDYIRGITELKELNEAMSIDKNPWVRKLGEFCERISICQNKPYLLKMPDKENINASSIEFLLNMYYVNKRRIAQQIGGE